jgi:type 1 fimbriae regulatory protein FimE
LLAYRHGLRAQELCQLRWSQIDLTHGRLHVNRAKGGIESVHPLHGPELRALRPLQGNSPYVFVTETGTPVTTAWFLRMLQRTGEAAKLSFAVHPHMLRHACGYKLANDGHDTRSLAHYLGHRKEVGAPGEFENLTDAELERALVERLAPLGLTGDAGSDTRH